MRPVYRCVCGIDARNKVLVASEDDDQDQVRQKHKVQKRQEIGGEVGDVVTGGSSTGDEGYFFKPTVLANVPENASILKEEIFGPVAPIVRFNTEEDAVRIANNTEYGLVSYAFTKDLARGMRLVDSLESGMSGINTGLVSNAAAPFGGVKQSGLGREGGAEGIEEYLETRYVLIPNL